MEQRNAISKTGVLVTLVVLLLFVALMFSALSKLRGRASRTVCGTHLKGLGTAFIVYAHDYDGRFAQFPGKGPWAKRLGFDYYLEKPDFSEGGAEEYSSRTISASLYLLVKEADVSPKSFTCPDSNPALGIVPFNGDNPAGRSIVELWDFGSEPHKHVGYSYHNPYGGFPPNKNLPSGFAIASDMSPWFKDGNIIPPGEENTTPQIIDITAPSTWATGNSINHRRKEKFAEAQNVLYADVHVSYEKEPNVGVNKDNIYTFWSASENPSEQDIQGGKNPTSRSKENDAKSKDDSFLAI